MPAATRIDPAPLRPAKSAPRVAVAPQPKPPPATPAPEPPVAAASDNLEQVQYYKRARIAPLMNNLCRQLLLEGPDNQEAVLECLVRSLAAIESELEQGTPLGRELRFTMLPMPSAQGRALVRRRAREKAAGGSPTRMSLAPADSRGQRPTTVPAATAAVTVRDEGAAANAASGDGHQRSGADVARPSTDKIEMDEQQAAARRIQRSWRSRSHLNRTQCTPCDPGTHDAALALEASYAALLVQRVVRRWSALRGVARLRQARVTQQFATDRSDLERDEATGRAAIAATEAAGASVYGVEAEQAEARHGIERSEGRGRLPLDLQHLDVEQCSLRRAITDEEASTFDLLEARAGSRAAFMRLARDEERRRGIHAEVALVSASMMALEVLAEATERTDQESTEYLLRRDVMHAEARSAVEVCDEVPARAAIHHDASAGINALLLEADLTGCEITERRGATTRESAAFEELWKASARSLCEASESRVRAIITDEELLERSAISSEHDEALAALVGQAEEARRRFVRDVGLLEADESRARDATEVEESATFDAQLLRGERHERQCIGHCADEVVARGVVAEDQRREVTPLYVDCVEARHRLQRSELEVHEARARQAGVFADETDTRARLSLELNETLSRASCRRDEASLRAQVVSHEHVGSFALSLLALRAIIAADLAADHQELVRAVPGVLRHLGDTMLNSFIAHRLAVLEHTGEPGVRAFIDQVEEPAAFHALATDAHRERTSHAISVQCDAIVNDAEPAQRDAIVRDQYALEARTLRHHGHQLAILAAEDNARRCHVGDEDTMRGCLVSGANARASILRDELADIIALSESYTAFENLVIETIAVHEAFAEAEEDARDDIINESADVYEAMYAIMISDGELIGEESADRTAAELLAVEPDEEAARIKIDRKAYKALLKLNELHISECGRIQALEEERGGGDEGEAPDLTYTATVSVAPRGGGGSGSLANASFGGGGGGMLSDDDDLGNTSPSNMSFSGPSVSGSIASAMSISVNTSMAADAKPVDDAVAKRIFGLMLNPPEAVVYNDGTLVIGMKLVVKASDCGIAVIIKNKHATRQVFGVSFGMVSKPRCMHLRANARDIGSIPPGETRYVKVKASCRGTIDDGWPIIALRCTVVGGADTTVEDGDAAGSDAGGDVGSQNSFVPSDDGGAPAPEGGGSGDASVAARVIPAGIGPLSLSIPLPAGLPTFITPVVIADLKAFAAKWKDISAEPSRTTEPVRAQITPACSMPTLVSRAATRTSKLLHMHLLRPAEDTAALSGELHIAEDGGSESSVPILLLIKGAVNNEKTLCALRIEARSTTPNAALEQVVAKQCAMLVRGNLNLANVRAGDGLAATVTSPVNSDTAAKARPLG